MLSEACALKASSRDFTNASDSAAVKNSLFANCAGRSSGVYVAYDQLPVRSGAPSEVCGALYVCATSDSDPRDMAATAATTTRIPASVSSIGPYFGGGAITSTVFTVNRRELLYLSAP